MRKLRVCTLLFSALQLCFLVWPGPGIYAAAPGLQVGMKMDDAMLVAARCVREAGGFKGRRDREQRIMRPSDKLSFLGITDEKRLDTLIRHIVKNEEMGVQSVWNYNGDVLVQRFIMSKKDLKDISMDSTLAKLGSVIAEKAGLPLLPFSTSQQVISNCIQRSRTVISENRSYSPPYMPNWNDIKAKEKITDHVTGNTREGFYNCLTEEKAFGLHEIRIQSPSNEEVPYQVNEKTKTDIRMMIFPEEQKVEKEHRVEYSFDDLANLLRAQARVTFSLKSTASRFVTSALLNQLLEYKEDQAGKQGKPYDREKALRGIEFSKHMTITQVMVDNELTEYTDLIEAEIICRLKFSVNSNPNPEDKGIFGPGCSQTKRDSQPDPYFVHPEDVKQEIDVTSIKGLVSQINAGISRAGIFDSKKNLQDLKVGDTIEAHIDAVVKEIKDAFKDVFPKRNR